MKYSIPAKFIAIVLCAAALFGALAGAGGILVLTSSGLYSQSVEQLQQETIRSYGEELAYVQSRRYFSSKVALSSESLLDSFYAQSTGLDFSHASYVIKDADGNVLAGYGSLTAEAAEQTYTFPVSGKYVYPVSVTGASGTEEVTETLPESGESSDSDRYRYVDIPASGAAVSSVVLLDRLGNQIYGNDILVTNMNLLFLNQEGTLVFRQQGAYSDTLSLYTAQDVYLAQFLGEDGTLLAYLAADAAPVGTVYYDVPEELVLVFEEYPQAVPEETAAETVAETVPETVPQTAAAEETGEGDWEETGENQDETWEEEGSDESWEEEGSEENWDEGEQSSASAMPEDGEAAAETQIPETAAPETVPETAAAETQAQETAPTLVSVQKEETVIDGRPLSDYDIRYAEYFDPESDEDVTVSYVSYVYVDMPEVTVELYTEAGVLGNENTYRFLSLLRPYRNGLFVLVFACVVVLIMLAVYLYCAAARKPGVSGRHAEGLNRLSLDVYLGLTLLGCFGAAYTLLTLCPSLLRESIGLCVGAGAGLGYAACLLIVGFCFACTAQLRTPGGYWWRNLLLVRAVCLAALLLGQLWQLMQEKTLPRLARFAGRLHRWLRRRVKSAGGKLNTLYARLPLMWQWLAGGALLVLMPLLFVFVNEMMLDVFLMKLNTWVIILLSVIADAALIVHWARCFGELQDAARRMGRGDLNATADDTGMRGCFKDFAADLNALAGVAVTAAKKQMKSERMKAELITNVSHDIKTPLTSIINYVDLLQHSSTEEERAQYLEVLSRQSQQLKKLIEDLIEMSKASTGNMAVDVQRVNAVESVNQALGEFSDKLARAQLTPVFRYIEDDIPILADGRLVWRVLSNLLSNVVKYAMPGTRVYIDLMGAEDEVTLSVKNVSREELNIDADDLLERFVRGDASRNTEGSGLGLNIAKSLMELQKGQLELMIDGDLFKATLIFPAAPEE